MVTGPTPTTEPRGNRRQEGRSPLERIAIAIVTLIGAALVIAPTIALTIGRRDSGIGLRAWPIDAGVQANRASELVANDQTVATLERADALSRAALVREPLNVTAARVQGIVAAARGRERSALSWFDYAQRLSRRDLPVQMMLIELAVARGDIAGALVHYDRALRTKRSAGEVLYPVLFQAVEDPKVLPVLARLLSRRPEWWYDFTIRWQDRQPPVEPLFTILTAERLDATDPRDRILAISAMRQMVAVGRVDLATRLHDQVAPAGTPLGGRFIDGSFNSGYDLPPFGWEFTSDAGIAGTVEQRGDPPRAALTIDVGGDQGGTVAQQLVRLAPGRYVLTFQAGELVPDGVVPIVSVTCLGVAEPLMEQRLPPGPARRSIAFQIAPGCAAQMIRVGGSAGNNDGLPRPWITDMAVQRIAGS